MSDTTMKTVFKALTISLFVFAVSACSGSKEEAANKYLNNGIELFEAEKLSKASVELRNALQIDPKLASAYYYLALISEEEQNWKSLFKNLTKVEQLDKTHVDARVKLGYLMLLAKQFDSAIERADGVLALDQNNADAFIIKASAFLGKELYDVAMEYVDKALEFEGDAVEIASVQASILHKQGKSQESLAILTRMIDQEEKNLHLILLRTEINEELNNLAAVEADYRSMIKNHPNERAFYLKLVSLLRDSGRVAEAQADLESYLRRFPDDTEVRLVMVQLVSSNNVERGDKLLDSYISAEPKNAQLRFYRINRLVAKSDLAEALVELDHIAEGDFDDQQTFRATAMKAGLKLSQGEEDLALRLVNTVLEKDSHFEQALLVRAGYYIAREDIEAAVNDLRVVLRNNPESERALVMLANAYVTSGSNQLADDTFRKVLDINPGNVQAAVPVIKSLLQKEDSDRSERIIENALAHSPDNEILLSILAQIKLSNQDIEGSQQVISRIEATGRNPAFGHYLSGRALQAQGKYQEAIEDYKQALAINADLNRALESLASSYRRLDKQSELLAYLKEFSARNVDNVAAHSVMATVYRQRKDYQSAIGALQSGLQRDPEWVQGYSALAGSYLAMGNNELAIDAYKKGLLLVPDSSLLKMLLASAYEKTEAFGKAMLLYEDVLAINPDHDAVINNLASLLTDQFASPANIKRAVALTERFADSEHPYFLDTYAWALVKSGLPEVAEPLFAKVTAIAPSVAVFHYHRGVGLKQQGKEQESKESLMLAQQALSGDDRLKDLIAQELTRF